MSLLSWMEVLAVLLALGYLLLAARESLWCWYCAFFSSLLYVVIFRDVNLFMEALLNVFYAVMAIVGWWQWRHGGEGQQGVKITSLHWRTHIVLLALMLGLALLNGWFMNRFTTAAWPFMDAFVAWSSVITTVLVIRKVLENWLYWLLIDSISLYLYVDRGLYLTALLYAAYLVIVVIGYLHWRKLYLISKGSE